jgi:hypothetical protein
MTFFRKLLTVLLMLILTLQGAAVAYASLQNTAHPAAAMPCHEHAAQDTHNAPASSAPGEMDITNHLCCHSIFTCATACALTTPAQKFGDVTRFVLPLATLFIPDAPDRPPRG